MIALEGATPEGAAGGLYASQSGRWMALPHAVRVVRDSFAAVVSVSASVLA